MRLFQRERKVTVIYYKPLLLMVILSIFMFLVLFIYNTCYSGTIKEKAKLKANYIAQKAIQGAVQQQLEEYEGEYSDMTDIVRKEDGTISSISVNTVAINQIKAGLTEKILERITAYGREEIDVPPLSFMGYKSFSWLPKVPVVVIPIEILSCDFKSTFTAQGINQTKHAISVAVQIDVKILLPVGSESFRVYTTVPLTETVIVGAVPDTYTNVEGVQESEADTILNLAS